MLRSSKFKKKDIKYKKFTHQSICDHVVDKKKSLLAAFYCLLLWRSASWSEEKKHTKFKKNLNKTVNDVLDKRMDGSFFLFVLVYFLFIPACCFCSAALITASSTWAARLC